jgi:hypothetical protein
MLRMIVMASLVLVTAIVLVFPVVQIESGQDGACCSAERHPGCCVTGRAGRDLKAIETVVSAFTRAAVSGIRTVICLGETTIEVYRALNGPAPTERS